MALDPKAFYRSEDMVHAETMSQGLMYHNDGFPLLSRDWPDIDCRRTSCQWNNSGVKCSVPSKAIIGEDGKCTGFKVKMAEPKKHDEDFGPLDGMEV